MGDDRDSPRYRRSMRFLKAHGLGNDYLVLTSGEAMSAQAVQALCHRHTGVGSDGILELVPSEVADAGLVIWNPDGSQAEKSGNGLRIFASWLHAHRGLPAAHTIEVASGVVQAEVLQPGLVRVEMGRASLEPEAVPVVRELVHAPFQLGEIELHLTAVGVGNPHCVAWFDSDVVLDELDWRAWGAHLETHPLFPNRTNVQFAQARSPSELHARVWERGAGETMASGSSACAVAASAWVLGRGAQQVEVRMPGGALSVAVSDTLELTLTGPVEELGRFELSAELLRRLD